MPKSVRVVAAVIEHEGRVLACRRKKEKAFGGKWEFPGGKIEPGETEQEALTRELAEELDLKSSSVGALLSRSTFISSVLEIDLSCYWVNVNRPPTTSTDHDELRWCTASELQDLDWAEADRNAVARLHNFPDSKQTIDISVEPK